MKLFPPGIPMNGWRISVNITNKDLEMVRNNFINPDLRLEFGSGGKVAIPRNIGLTTLTIEAKGKNTLTLDF
jgi:hypothetical protein